MAPVIQYPRRAGKTAAAKRKPIRFVPDDCVHPLTAAELAGGMQPTRDRMECPLCGKLHAPKATTAPQWSEAHRCYVVTRMALCDHHKEPIALLCDQAADKVTFDDRGRPIDCTPAGPQLGPIEVIDTPDHVATLRRLYPALVAVEDAL